jgi:hypothetical protein
MAVDALRATFVVGYGISIDIIALRAMHKIAPHEV